MTSYKQFTYYDVANTKKKVLELTTNNETGIFAFIIYNTSLQLSDLTFPDNIVNKLEKEQHPAQNLGSPNYNLLFRYKPNGNPPDGYATATFYQKWIFHTNDKTLEPDLVVDWVNSTANTGTPNVSFTPDALTSGFSDTYPENWNRETMARSTSEGGGDPHIRPYFNPRNKVYLLPTNDSNYKYFDTQDTSERIVINAQTYLLSFDRIIFAEELKIKRHGRDNWDKVPQAIENITKYPKTMETKEEHDTSFAKYISVIYQTASVSEQLIIDVESLEITKDEIKDKITISSIKDSDAIHYKSKKSDIKNIKMREITIQSKKLDIIRMIIYRDYDRLNHRSHISILFRNHNRKYLQRCAGILMNIKTHGMIIPSLNHIDRINYDHRTDNRLETVESYLAKWKAPLRKERFRIRNMIRANDFSLLDPLEKRAKEEKNEIVSTIQTVK